MITALILVGLPLLVAVSWFYSLRNRDPVVRSLNSVFSFIALAFGAFMVFAAIKAFCTNPHSVTSFYSYFFLFVGMLLLACAVIGISLKKH